MKPYVAKILETATDSQYLVWDGRVFQAIFFIDDAQAKRYAKNCNADFCSVELKVS